MQPQATIIIAAYEAATVLPRCLAAAHAQTGVRVDVVVADDASRDETSEVARGHPNTVLVRLAQNSGPAAARNHALDVAKGDWIVVLDADDTMTPHRISEMIALADATSADVVLGNFIRVNENEVPMDDGPFLPLADLNPNERVTLESYVAANSMSPNSSNYGYLKPIFRRAVLERCGIRYDETLRNSEDYHIVLALLAAGANVVISPQPDYLYQVSSGSISHRVSPDLICKLIMAEDKFQAGLGAEATPTLTKLLLKRRINLVNMMDSENVLHALKARRFDAAFSILAKRPQSGPRVVRQIGEAISKRLGRL